MSKRRLIKTEENPKATGKKTRGSIKNSIKAIGIYGGTHSREHELLTRIETVTAASSSSIFEKVNRPSASTRNDLSKYARAC